MCARWIAAASLPALALLLQACAGDPKLIRSDGELAACDGRHCVSSQADNPEYQVPPMRYAGSSRSARERLVRFIQAQDDSEVVTNSDCYVHAVFQGGVIRGPDDLELWFCSRPGFIEVRSASRSGLQLSDDNRERVQSLRDALAIDADRSLNQ